MRMFLMNIANQLLGLPEVAGKANSVLKTIVGPCLSVIGSLGIIYIIVLGVQYAKSESDDKRAECKKRITNLTIGVIVMIIMITLMFAIDWATVVPEMFGYIDPRNQA